MTEIIREMQNIKGMTVEMLNGEINVTMWDTPENEQYFYNHTLEIFDAIKKAKALGYKVNIKYTSDQ